MRLASIGEGGSHHLVPSMRAVQPDLFGEYDAEQSTLAELHSRRASDEARYQRVWFIAAYDAAGGTKAGDRVLGWQCPACSGIEWSSFTLELNHGYRPGSFDRWPFSHLGDPWGTRCWRTIRGLDVDADVAHDGIGVIRPRAVRRVAAPARRRAEASPHAAARPERAT